MQPRIAIGLSVFMSHRGVMPISLFIVCQCLKLRVHPAPGVHILAAGYIDLKPVHPACACFSRILNRFL